MNSVPPRTTWNPERKWKHDSWMHLNYGSRCVFRFVCVECVCVCVGVVLASEPVLSPG